MRLLQTLFAGALSLALLASPAFPAGTIFGLPLSQQLDSNGDPIVGALLTIYEADSTTPVTVYEDFGLTSETSNPITTDASGRIPEFWLDDGSYRARLTTAGGVVIFDLLNTTALGASAGGAGEGSTVSQNSIFTTGMFTWVPVNATKTGWVRANGRTIGSVASGASERANADTQPLYEWLWNNCSNTNCPVSTGRGSSASADFAANKTIGTLDMRGRTPIGLDTMGNDAADVVASATTAGNSGGAESVTLTTTELPAHTHEAGSYEAATHTHSIVASGTTSTNGDHSHTTANAGGTSGATAGGSARADASTGSTSTNGDHAHTVTVTGTTGASGALTVSGTSGETGSGTAFSIMNPYKAGSWYIRL